MTLSSLQLTVRCHQQGLLSKEAAADVLQVRSKLYKQAMEKEALFLFSGLKEIAENAARRLGGFKDDLMREVRSGGRVGPRPPIHGEGGIPASVAVKGKDGLPMKDYHGKPVMNDLTGQVAKEYPEDPRSWGSTIGHLGKIMALGAGVSALGMGVKGVMNHSQDKRVRKEIESSYKQMFVEHPDLNTRDKERVTRYFDVLARYAPSLAAEPLVAGAWVKQFSDRQHADASVIDQISEVQATIDRHHEGKRLFNPDNFDAGVGFARDAISGG